MTDHLVLRTVYLPPELDEKLRVAAYRRGVLKGDIIREALERELASFPSFADELKDAKR